MLNQTRKRMEVERLQAQHELDKVKGERDELEDRLERALEHVAARGPNGPGPIFMKIASYPIH